MENNHHVPLAVFGFLLILAGSTLFWFGGAVGFDEPIVAAGAALTGVLVFAISRVVMFLEALQGQLRVLIKLQRPDFFDD